MNNKKMDKSISQLSFQEHVNLTAKSQCNNNIPVLRCHSALGLDRKINKCIL